MSWSSVLRRSSSAPSSSSASKPTDLSICLRRRGLDVIELREFCKETFEDHDDKSITVWMQGPSETPYEKFKFQIRFELPERYPLCSPSVGFLTKIWHPNIDFASGTVCLDLLNQRWTPILTLRHIIEFLLPELLRDPNPDSPLNCEAATQLQSSVEVFKAMVLGNLAIHGVPVATAESAPEPVAESAPEPVAESAPVTKVAASLRKRARKDEDDD